MFLQSFPPVTGCVAVFVRMYPMKFSKMVLLVLLVGASFAMSPASAFAGNDKGNQSDNGNGKGKGNGGPATPTQVSTPKTR